MTFCNAYAKPFFNGSEPVGNGALMNLECCCSRYGIATSREIGPESVAKYVFAGVSKQRAQLLRDQVTHRLHICSEDSFESHIRVPGYPCAGQAANFISLPSALVTAPETGEPLINGP